jgi:hypothetical protein
LKFQKRRRRDWPRERACRPRPRRAEIGGDRRGAGHPEEVPGHGRTRHDGWICASHPLGVFEWREVCVLMEEVTQRSGRANSGSLRVEDLIFLDDLRALGVPWIDRLIEPCSSREDVERVWAQIRTWGPDHEDASDLLDLSAHMPQLVHAAEQALAMIRLCENYRP